MISGREPPWFDQVSPNLLRNRNIREYLSNFTSKDHPEVVKLTLLFGIVNLRKLFSGKLFSIENLREILTSHQVAAVVESSLPDVRAQLDNLQNQLEDVTEMVYDRHQSPVKAHLASNQGAKNADRPPSPHLPWKQFSVSAFNGHQDSDVRATDNQPHSKPKAAAEAAKNLRHGSASPSNQRRNGPARKSVNVIVPAAVLPCSDWRYDVSRTWSPPGRRRSPTREEDRHIGPLYPSWWGDGSIDAPQVAPKPKMPVRESKPPPRLAYSVLPDPVPIFQDDLVTSRYLQVPSSRYGNATITTTQGNQQQQVATEAQGRVAADTVADTHASQDEYSASITLNPAAAARHQGWLSLPAQPKGLQGDATADGTLPSAMINRDTLAPPAWYDMLQSVLEPSKHQQTPSRSDMSNPPRPSALQTQHVTSHSLQSHDHAYNPPSGHPISRTAEKTGVADENEWSDHLPVQTQNVELLQGAGLSWSTSQNMNAGRSESPDAAAWNDEAMAMVMNDGREQDEVVNSHRAGIIRMGSLQAGPSSADRGGGSASSRQRLSASYGGGIGSSHYKRVESRIKEQVRKDKAAAAAAAAGLLMNRGTYVVPFPRAALETSTVLPLSSDRLLIQQQTDVQQQKKMEAGWKHVGGGHGVNGTPTHRYQPAAAAAAAPSHLNKPSSLVASSSPAAPAITGISPAAAASLPSSSHSTPSQIVDRLASNPWTAWTLKDLDTNPQQQPNPGHGIKAEAIAVQTLDSIAVQTLDSIAVQTLDSNASPSSYHSSTLAPDHQPWWLIPQEHASDVSTDTDRSLPPNTAAAAVSGGNQKLAGTDNTQAAAMMYSLQDGRAHDDPPPYQMLSSTAGRASTPGFLFSPGPLFEADHSANSRAVMNPSTNSWRAHDWVLSSSRPWLTSLLGPTTTPQTLSSSGIGVACPEVPAAAPYSLVAAATAAGQKKVGAGAVRGGVAWEVPGPSPGDLKVSVILQNRAAEPHSGARQSKGSGWMGDFGHLNY
ncbi:hypothetical protein CEUSTIGMA_g8100.t1 [Chlamydomonas eustigma]|uniref:Uncharacterized protein n=1 Tax=Chlamydomonas eustigma TaxID=1157962 RepID=A0A250XC46_9CHLO|nr:hypothetical protein CEUSTIGMA_g8100.t1 [Chlamydomonas eustigma]|eukprot:GAX80665.1 hypothetical protein CEUSTIGMA_g8100.t1 [Chlamydomonas eustigma]